MSKKIEVLFLCTGNSCRSQMAEGWTRFLQSETMNVYSAGIETHGLNPYAIQVMAEVGVDISTQKSQNISEFSSTHLDVVITVCDNAQQTCPIFSGDCKVVHVGFDDPPRYANEAKVAGKSKEDQLDCYRKVRDEIRTFVETLPEFLIKHGIKISVWPV